MATASILQTEEDRIMYASLFDDFKGQNLKSRGSLIEKKIEFLEGLAGKVSNRRSRRWLNDRLLMELVPRLDADEIRGLFAPPPWGEEAPPSVFSMTNTGEWDSFRNIDMDKEASMMGSLGESSTKQKDGLNVDKLAVLSAWHRINNRTRDALRRCLLLDLINGYEQRVRSFVEKESRDDVLVLSVRDPFHRLILHGVCEFYNLVSVTADESKGGGEAFKVTRIRKKQNGSKYNIPNITLCSFLKMAKEGFW